METIRRKTLLYKTRVPGMDYCLNHVLGCAHGCRYPCYAYAMKKSYGQVGSYEEWCKPKIVENARELLEKELLRLKDTVTRVHLCFATDPFMVACPEITDLSLQIIELLAANHIPCSTLTKGLHPQHLADTHRYGADNEYGISIVSLCEAFRAQWEPGAAPYRQRIDALRYLAGRGLYTWAHIEPYPTPNIVAQDITPLLEQISFVKSLSFGRWNYNPLAQQYKNYHQFYRDQETIVREFCRRYTIHCS